MSFTRIAAAAALALAGALAQGAAQAATTITVAVFPDLDRSIKEALPQWNKLHPDIKVKLVALERKDHHNAMTTALAAGSRLPDVMAIDFDYLGRFAESAGLEDLNQAPYSAGQYRNQLVPYTMVQGTNSRGQLTAMPTDIGPSVLFYRKDLMDKAGIKESDLTASFESFVAAGKKLKAATGVNLLSRAADLKDILIRSNIKPGDGLFFGPKGEVLVESPRFVKAFEAAKAARVAGIDARTTLWSSEWAEGFKRGTVGSQVMGIWLAGHLSKWMATGSAGQWRVAPVPGGVHASYGGSFYAIPKKAPNKPAAWAFVKFMTTNKDVQLNSLKTNSAYPALLAAQNDPFIEQPQAYFGGQKALIVARDVAAKVPLIRPDRYDAVANDVVDSELQNVLEQNKDIRAALADAKRLIERRARR